MRISDAGIYLLVGILGLLVTAWLPIGRLRIIFTVVGAVLAWLLFFNLLYCNRMLDRIHKLRVDLNKKYDRVSLTEAEVINMVKESDVITDEFEYLMNDRKDKK